MDEPRRPGRGRFWRRPSREPVEQRNPDDIDDDGGDGSAGVREPRRPLPLGPVAGAAYAPPPAEPLVAQLPDPRY